MLKISFVRLIFISISLAWVPIFTLAHSVENTGAVIYITPEGYEPREIIVHQGGKVIFKNISGENRWPASNIHPTHRAYPDSGIEKCGTPDSNKIFDSCGLAPGETYEFIFEHVGEWGYHDHLDPKLKGRITVLEDPDFIPSGKTIAEEGSFVSVLQRTAQFLRSLWDRFKITFDPSPYLKYERDEDLSSQSITAIVNDEGSLRYWMQKVGPQKIMQKLLSDSGGGSAFDCHQEAHIIGRIAYELEGGSALEKGDASCHSGFYHGAMEAFLSQNGTANLAQNIEGLCSSFPSSFGRFECLHGVGHGVMAFEDYDLPKAISSCQKLKTDFEESSCYGGVFMENIVAGQGFGAIPGHETEWLSEDPQFPCNSVSQDYSVRYQCWQMQTSWMLTLFNYDFKKVMDECLKAPEDMIAVCFKSLGRDAAGYTLRDPQKIMEICDSVPRRNDYYEQCLIGAVNVIVDFWGASVGDRASQLCQMASEPGKQACYSTLFGRLFNIFSDAPSRRDVCDTFEIEYRRNYCTRL